MADPVRTRLARRRALLVLLWRAARWRLLAVGALAVAQGLAPTGAILATGALVASLDEPGRAGLGLALFGGALLCGAVVAPVLDYQVRVLDGRYGQQVHEAIAAATLRVPGIAALDDPQVAGELAALEEFERVDGFVLAVAHLRELIQRRTSGVGALAILAVFAWWAPLVMLIAWRGLGHGLRRWVEHGAGLGATIAAQRMRRPRYLRSVVVDAQAAKEVRVFGLADWLVHGYVHAYQDALRHIWAGRRLGAQAVLAATGGVVVAHVLVLSAAGRQAVAGTLAVAQLVVIVQAVLGTNALGFVGEPELTLGRARQVAWRALRLARTLPAAQSRPQSEAHSGAQPAPAADPAPEPLEVRFTGVRFTYPARSAPTLDGLDLTVPAGQSVAIVGANGAGKSTIVKLLCGLYRPNQGRVEIGGRPAAEQSGRLGVIFQNFVRYELPLRVNVGFGSRHAAADERVLSAVLTAAGAADLADRLPAGWDTVLSAGYPGGRDLSGGQWQKVALARALAAVHGGAGLLVLDEPTAALDVRAEAELFDRFLEATRGVTTILVSHRLASVCRADRIVVLDGGRVIEDGTHEQLKAAGGQYATMFALQADRFTLDADQEWEAVGG